MVEAKSAEMSSRLEDTANTTAPTGTTQTTTQDVAKPEEATEEFSIITTGARSKSKRIQAIDEDEPLVDTTAALPKRSKKTERATKRLMRRQQKLATRRGPATLVDLPAELFEDILSYLRASDILNVLQVNRSFHAFITANEASIARAITRRRYAVLAPCFPLPRAFSSIPDPARPALLSDSRQNLLQIHKKPYQHVQPIDPTDICTCMTCMLAWNNLAMIIDLAHWQRNLDRREPIPMIPRGRNPDWNRELLERNADLVRKAMERPIFYTLILQHHLETTVSTLIRTLRGQKTVHPKRVYHLSRPEAESGIETDAFLERQGPECHEFPFHRDNYYNLNAYVPNRKWSRSEERWMYYPEGAHDRDLQWVKDRFVPDANKPPASSEQIDKRKREKELDGFAAQFNAQASVQASTGPESPTDSGFAGSEKGSNHDR